MVGRVIRSEICVVGGSVVPVGCDVGCVLWGVMVVCVVVSTLWPTLAHSGTLWPILVHSGPLWHTLAQSGLRWPNLAHSLTW